MATTCSGVWLVAASANSDLIPQHLLRRCGMKEMDEPTIVCSQDELEPTTTLVDRPLVATSVLPIGRCWYVLREWARPKLASYGVMDFC